MGSVLLGILASLIQLAVMVGIVVLIVKAVGGRRKTSTESVGVLIRRVFVYTLMLSMLLLLGIGIGGLIEAALPNSGEITDSSTDAALSIAFVIVALPVYAGLCVYTARRLQTDSNEQSSTGWAFYLTVALIGSLIAAMALVGSALSEVAGGEAPERTTIINATIWIAVWVAHWMVSQRFEPRNSQLHLLAGSSIGLIWASVGALATAIAVLSTIYDELFATSLTGNDLSDLLRPAAVLAVGLPTWWWYWARHSRGAARTSLWHAYVLLVGVMGGVVTVIVGGGILVFSVLDWFLGDVSTSAAAHFDTVPGAVAALFVGSAVWAYHAHVLGDRESRVRDEIGRVYDYLLSAAGLLVATSGVAVLLGAALKSLSSQGSVATSDGDILPTALTLLVVGVPLWWRYWSTIQRYRRSDPKGELTSITRRIYIVGLFGIAAIVAVISLIVIVFIVVEDVLDGAVGWITVSDTAIAIALLITAGAIAWYHFVVFREDREALGPDAHIDEVPEDEQLVLPGDLEEAVAALMADGIDTVTIAKVPGGYYVSG